MNCAACSLVRGCELPIQFRVGVVSNLNDGGLNVSCCYVSVRGERNLRGRLIIFCAGFDRVLLRLVGVRHESGTGSGCRRVKCAAGLRAVSVHMIDP